MANRVAVVTGASRGIGKQLSVDLARAGFDVVCVARDDGPGLPGTAAETAAMVEAEGRRAMAVDLDVRDEAGIEELARRVTDTWGPCHLLVNNAGIAVPGSTLDQPTKRWRLSIDVNLNGPLYTTYYFLPHMTEGDARVINISSSAAVSPQFGRASYTVSKLALESLTECLGYETQGRAAVNCVRIDILVFSEGGVAALPGIDASDREDPVVVSDAVLWLAEQPIDYTGKVLTLTELREKGVVRPTTRVGDRPDWAR